MANRILFVSHTADSIGPTNSLLLLVKHLRERYDVSVVLPGQGLFSDSLEREEIPFYSFGSLGKRSIAAIIRTIRLGRFDLVYGNNTGGASRNAFVAAKLAGVPFICHVRGMGWSWSWRSKGFLRLADAVIAVSEACAESVSRFVASERLHVVYNGAELPLYRTGPEPALDSGRAKDGVASDDVTLISVAHIRPRKGQKYAVEAMDDIAREVPSARLVLVGSLDRDQGYVDEIERLIRRKKLEIRVEIKGFRSDVFQLLENASIYLHTAVEDPHPRSLVESMAAGLPAVAFDVDGVSETVIDGQTGYLVEKGDVAGLVKAVVKLMRDPSLRARLGSNAKRHAEERFSAPATARQVSDIIDRVLGGAKP